jgi:hypothetical protein
MAMENVFTGKTATLTLSQGTDPKRPNENTDSAAVLKTYFDSPSSVVVGRAVGVQVAVTTNLEEFHQIGSRLPVVLHPGDISISGSIDRAYVSGALVTLLLGRGAVAGFPEPFAQPAFDMFITLADPGVTAVTKPTTSASVLLSGVKFQNWALRLPEDEFVMENVTFRALALHVIDVPPPGANAAASGVLKPFGDAPKP